jgi:hypothetical protein
VNQHTADDIEAASSSVRRRHRFTRLERWIGTVPDVLGLATRIVIWLSIAACLLTLVHAFFRFIGYAPPIAVDDSLGNVSVNLANEGRYGFPASPVQGFSEALRLDTFLNYGPWPFAVGAMLDWLFGTSYVIQRSVHLVGLLGSCLAFFLVFRRVSAAAVATFVVLSALVFWQLEWPMVRPDFAVALWGALALACATKALQDDNPWAWLGYGYSAASAATTHPIALSLIPWAGTLWLISFLLFARASAGAQAPYWRPWRSFISLCIGGLAGILTYLAAVRFQIAEVFQLWSGGKQFIASADARSFTSIFVTHFWSAWKTTSVLFWTLAIGFAAATALILVGAWLRRPLRLRVWALLIPPVSLAITYQSSLGIYGNFHSGYSLLSHVSTLWAVAACIGAIATVANQANRLSGRIWEIGAGVVAAVLLLWTTATLTSRDESWPAYAKTFVHFDDYMGEVTDILPDGASVWGSIVFGLASGVRFDFVQFADAAALAVDFPAAQRAAISPDFLAVNDLLKNIAYSFVARRAEQNASASLTHLDAVPTLFPELRYRLMALIDAPPYGVTRVYGRVHDESPTGAPIVAVNEGTSLQWARRLGPPMAFAAEAVEPAMFRLTVQDTVEAAADRTRAVRLPAGLYVITVSVQGTSATSVGLIAATPLHRVVSVATAESGFRMPQAPYFPGESRVDIIVRHGGGLIYLSQFDGNPNADFSIVEVRRIEYLQPWKHPVPVPPLSQWQLAGRSQSATPDGRGGMHVVGNNDRFSYQLVSPPIPVQPDATLRVSADLEVARGTAALGLLDEKGAWLVGPSVSRSTFEFATGENRAVTMVISAMDQVPPPLPLEFDLSQPELSIVGYGDDYLHTLAGCRSGKRRPALCGPAP